MPILDYVDNKVIILKASTTVATALDRLRSYRKSFFVIEKFDDYFYIEKAKAKKTFQKMEPDIILDEAFDFSSLKQLPVISTSTSIYQLKKNGMYVVKTSNEEVYFLWNKVRSAKKESPSNPSVPKPPISPNPSVPINIPKGIDDFVTDVPDFSFDEKMEDVADGMEDAADEMEEVTAEGGGLPGGANKVPPFEAYPSISNPDEIQPEETFTIYIGFSKEQDTSLENATKISIPKPKENDFVQVSLMAIGATVNDNRLKPLILDTDAQVAFECTAGTGVKEITLIATYFYQMQPVGTATRRIQLDEGKNKLVPEKNTTPVGCSLQLAHLKYDNALLDVTVTITRDVVGKRLLWKIIAPAPHVDEHYEVSIDDTQSFAKVIGSELSREGYKDIAANNVLVTLGEQIAEFVPGELFEILQAVHDEINRKPKVLIWTDEPYVPWELAIAEELQIDSDAPPFLCTQTIMGRWWLNEQVVCPPPCQMKVEELTAIAAEYPFGSKFRPLKEAIEEKKFLMNEFGADEVKANKKDILKMTGQRDKVPGHWVHMALHGFSHPDKNEQSLIFEDGELSPMAMIGSYKCGDIPAISFLFLNACQVGTAGTSLGQASGFPGIMLKKGMLGFIAPLWEVHDVAARAFAEHFYTETMNNGAEIGTTLTNLKKAYDYEDSLTPLAYIYYGHPALKIQY